MTPEMLTAIGHLYDIAWTMLATLDVDWWLQIDPELGRPTVRLRVTDRRDPLRKWQLEMSARAMSDKAGRVLIERKVREFRNMIRAD